MIILGLIAVIIGFMVLLFSTEDGSTFCIVFTGAGFFMMVTSLAFSTAYCNKFDKAGTYSINSTLAPRTLENQKVVQLMSDYKADSESYMYSKIIVSDKVSDDVYCFLFPLVKDCRNIAISNPTKIINTKEIPVIKTLDNTDLLYLEGKKFSLTGVDSELKKKLVSGTEQEIKVIYDSDDKAPNGVITECKISVID